MAGKRYDQYNIAPSEAGTTDYNRYPEATHGQDEDLDTTRFDKQRLTQSQQDAKGQPIPPNVPAPSAEAQRAARREDELAEEAEELDEAQPGAAETHPGKENPLV